MIKCLTKLHDPEHYAKMAAPHANEAAAQAALDAFFVDIDAARERHRIPEVVIVSGAIHDGAGDAGDERGIVEIRAAEGGADAKDLVREQFSVYAKRAARHGL